MTEFRAGFVSIVGRPNVGKSTLLNALLGQKIAAVSPRPQTTRRRQLGIVTLPNAQLVFVDTPGIHLARRKLGIFLNQEARESLEGVDAILFLVDLSVPPSHDDARIGALLSELPRRAPVILVANKVDLILPDAGSENLAAYRALLRNGPDEVTVSATRGDGVQALVELLISKCRVRPPEYEESQITDLYEREIAADLIREAALMKLRDEVPHGIAVRVDEFSERANGTAYIAATLLVERQSQKGIVIGEGGKMLKQIGTAARQEIEAMGGHKVFLELRVKLEKDWRNNEAVLRRLGYNIKH